MSAQAGYGKVRHGKVRSGSAGQGRASQGVLRFAKREPKGSFFNAHAFCFYSQPIIIFMVVLLQSQNLAMDERLRLQRKLARTWVNIISRCHDETNPGYHWYGGRGISMCDQWRNDISVFIADVGYPENASLSLDRINNDGNYEPGNCRWATQEEQNSNTRRNRYIEYNGRRQTIKQWAEEYDVAPNRVCERLRRGWTIERTLNTYCPQGYEEGRRRHNEAAKSLWVSKGKEWQKKSRDRALVARENGTTA
jgi:hypothetical protein